MHMLTSTSCDSGMDCFKLVLSQLPIPVTIAGFEDGQAYYMNSQAVSLFRLTPGSALSCNVIDFYMDPTRRQKFMVKLERSGVVEGFEIECKDGDGSRFWAMLSSKRLEYEGKDAILSIFTDITQRKRLEQELLYTSQHDPLTGAYNRGFFVTSLEMEIARARRYGEDLSMLMLDVDRFKSVNDEHGHLIGDKVLEWLVSTVRPSLRQMDVLCWIGGEEFVVLLPETGLEGAHKVAHRILCSFAESSFEDRKVSLKITVSIGVSSLGAADDTDSFFRRTDDALLEAKRSGRNCVVHR